MPKHYYNHLVCGGTFDHLHAGHKHFLGRAFALSKYVTIGLTKYGFYQKPSPDAIQSYDVRKQALTDYLKQQNWLYRAHIAPIYDQFGPSIHNLPFQAILATSDTLPGVQKVNWIRQKNWLKPLKVEKVDLLTGISSSLIRRGSFAKNGYFTRNYYLPAQNRRFFKEPLGKLYYSPHSYAWSALRAKKTIAKTKPPFVIVVGDIATHSFVQQNIGFNIAVYDHKTKRQPIANSLHCRLIKRANRLSKTTNSNSTISAETMAKTKALFTHKNKQILKVTGEEDLTVLPLILNAPLGSLVFYGQPEQGLVKVKVSLDKKKQVLNLLKHFH